MLGLLAPASAQAQSTITIWSSQLTVNANSSDAGCSNFSSSLTNCSSAFVDDDFTYRGTTYRVGHFSANTDGNIYLEFVGVTASAAKTALGSMTLRTFGRKVPLGNARLHSNGRLLVLSSDLHRHLSNGDVIGVGLEAPKPVAPAKPAGFSAAEGNARATLSWTDPGDATVTGHQYRRKAGRGAWGAWTDIPSSASGGGNADSFTVTNLMNGVVYAFQLRAVNAAGAGPASAEARATPVPPTIVWSAMIEVDRSYYGGFLGCSNSRLFHANCADRLSDNDFVYRGVTYTVTAARWLESEKVFQLSFAGLNRSSIPARFASLPAWAAKKALGGLTLHVGNGRRLAIGRAGISNSGRYLTWPLEHNPGWHEGGRRVSLSLETPTRPAKPRDFAVAAEDAGATLFWFEASSVRAADRFDFTVTGHQYRQKAGGGAWGAWTDIPDSGSGGTNIASYAVTGLMNGVTYAFQLRAVNAAGAGPASDAATAVTPAVQNTLWSATLTVDHGDGDAGCGGGRDSCSSALTDDDFTYNGVTYKITSLLRTGSRSIGDTGNGALKIAIAGLSDTAASALTLVVGDRKFAFSRRAQWSSIQHPRWTDGLAVSVSLVGPPSTTTMAPPPAGPALEWARVNGAELALRFDKGLDESSVPSTSAFAVSVAGSARSVSSVAVRQDLVTLTLASAVSAGETVTVGYTPPSSGGLRLSGGGAAVAAFSGQAVTNDTPAGQPQVQGPPGTAEALTALTARIASAPSEHRGAGEFALRVAFSAPVAGRAKDAVIEVTGGTLARAVRVKKRKDLWELRLAPSGHGAVTVTLPATADCAAAGAVCTADGRRLETALTHTVQGPVALSVADASAREGPGATLDFAVTLSRAASGEVTVRYATRDGTAKKGKDYRKAKGTLSFAAGETSKTVSVALLDDAHDEGSETFRLVLKKATGAAIADGEATGTIENSDPLQQDWLARFGRAAAADAVAAVTARLETPREAGSHLTLAGQRVDLSDTDGDAALQQGLAGFATLLGGPCGAGPEPEADGWAGRGAARDGAGAVACPAPRLTGRELLLGSSFRAVLGGGAGPQWTGWGQGASVSAFSSATPSLSLSGETATGSLGMDYEHGQLLAGFAMTHSLGEGTAEGAGRRYAMGSAVTTMLPYVRYALSERLSAWGLAGTGAGRLTLDLDGGAPERYGADLSMTLAAMGVRGDLVRPAEAGGFALALKADAFWVRTESDSVSTPEAGNLAGAQADVSRLRAVLDGSRTFALAGGGTLTPSMALGFRHDGGDAETGTGFELGAGVGYADPSRGLDLALRVHGLAAHAADGYDEWGVSGSLRLAPGAAGRGLSASLTPSYGAAPGGPERLWMLPDASGLAANGDAAMSSRLDAEVGYGLAVSGGFTGTPHVGLGLSDTARELRLGWRLSPAGGGGFELHLDAARTESGVDPETEHRVGLGLTTHW